MVGPELAHVSLCIGSLQSPCFNQNCGQNSMSFDDRVHDYLYLCNDYKEWTFEGIKSYETISWQKNEKLLENSQSGHWMLTCVVGAEVYVCTHPSHGIHWNFLKKITAENAHPKRLF